MRERYRRQQEAERQRQRAYQRKEALRAAMTCSVPKRLRHNLGFLLLLASSCFLMIQSN
jgi:hypothetical protein